MLKGKLKLLFSLIINVGLISAFPVSAEQPSAVLNLRAGYAAENDITFVSGSLEAETDAAAYSITLNFNPEYLEFVDAESNLSYGAFYYNSVSEDCVNLVWSDTENRSLNGEIFSASFKTKGDTADLTVPVELGHSVMGNDSMEEIPFEPAYCEIIVLENYKWGDVNNDGITSLSDVVAINQFYIDSEQFSLDSQMKINSDTDTNKILNISDSNNILKYVRNNIKEKM